MLDYHWSEVQQFVLILFGFINFPTCILPAKVPCAMFVFNKGYTVLKIIRISNLQADF